MKNRINQSIFNLALVAITLFFFQVNSLAYTSGDTTQCKGKKECKMDCKEKKECCKKGTGECKSDKKGCSEVKENAGLKTLQKSKIDLKKIDANKDGKVFQCTMCADQLSDVSGKCPKCKMDMKEVTLKDAKALLKKSGLKSK